VCYFIWCTALVQLDVVGSGCGTLRCRMRTLSVIVASCWFSLFSHIIKSTHSCLHHSGFVTVKAEDAQHMRNPSYTGNQSKQ